MARLLQGLAGSLPSVTMQCTYIVCGTSVVLWPAWRNRGLHTINLHVYKFFMWVPDTTFMMVVCAKFRKSVLVLLYWILHQTWLYRAGH